MKINKSNFAVIFLSLLIFGCAEKEHGEQMKTEPKTDIVALSRFIQLPIQPVSVLWQTADITNNTNSPGPKDWALLALVEFKQDELVALHNKVGQHKGPVQIPTSQFHGWLPDDIKDKFSMDENNLFYSTSMEAKEAEAFALSPLLNGFYVQVNENRILLYLYTM